MKKILTILIIMLISGPLSATDRRECDYHDSPGCLNLTINNIGVSFGNSRVTHGLRINLRDECVKRVDGVNMTLWKPGRNPDAVFRGLSLGLYGPWADEIHFLALGGVHVNANSALNGISIAGLANVSGGVMNGIFLTAGANLSRDDFSGISFGGLANVCD
ncbi:MAG: hypothetical protein GF417_10255, partial [Candidatus Latescibacteria bacterium]|nr:hypothetical protein [bacterium]MBD3424809.1 hypothetical protein [Candidatus Latescibacterota bacterium]